jgi:hypothetical protein
MSSASGDADLATASASDGEVGRGHGAKGTKNPVDPELVSDPDPPEKLTTSLQERPAPTGGGGGSGVDEQAASEPPACRPSVAAETQPDCLQS